MRIRIQWPDGKVTATLKDTPTSRALFSALPCSSSANTWGEEVYFSISIDAHLEPDAQQVVPPGTVCFWVEGSSLAIPHSPTPISRGEESRLITKVNILGQVKENPSILASVKDGQPIHVELL